MGFFSGLLILSCIVGVVILVVMISYKFKELDNDYTSKINSLSTAINVGMSNAAEYDRQQQNQLTSLSSVNQGQDTTIHMLATSNTMLQNAISAVDQNARSMIGTQANNLVQLQNSLNSVDQYSKNMMGTYSSNLQTLQATVSNIGVKSDTLSSTVQRISSSNTIYDSQFASQWRSNAAYDTRFVSQTQSNVGFDSRINQLSSQVGSIGNANALSNTMSVNLGALSNNLYTRLTTVSYNQNDLQNSFSNLNGLSRNFISGQTNSNTDFFAFRQQQQTLNSTFITACNLNNAVNALNGQVNALSDSNNRVHAMLASGLSTMSNQINSTSNMSFTLSNQINIVANNLAARVISGTDNINTKDLMASNMNIASMLYANKLYTASGLVINKSPNVMPVVYGSMIESQSTQNRTGITASSNATRLFTSGANTIALSYLSDPVAGSFKDALTVNSNSSGLNTNVSGSLCIDNVCITSTQLGKLLAQLPITRQIIIYNVGIGGNMWKSYDYNVLIQRYPVGTYFYIKYSGKKYRLRFNAPENSQIKSTDFEKTLDDGKTWIPTVAGDLPVNPNQPTNPISVDELVNP